MLASASFVHAAMIGQWSPLLTAAAVMPSLAFLLALKPTVGAAVVAASLTWRVTWRAALGGVVCAVVAFALVPGWVGEWRAALTGAFHFQTLIARPAGVLLLLALLRWRRFDARLVLALACVPQTPVIYEALPLFLVPESRREMLVLLLCSGLELVVQQAMMRGLDGPASAHASGTALLVVMYFPCLIMVLRRPNAGSIPTWIERWAARLPIWLRGTQPTESPSRSPVRPRLDPTHEAPTTGGRSRSDSAQTED